MSEASVINLFTAVRVLLFGGILFVLPKIMRKGLLFGAYVGEEFAAGDATRALVRNWNRGCLMLIGVALIVGLGISATGHPLAGNITATALLVVGGLWLYLRSYYAAKAMAPADSLRQAEQASAPLDLTAPAGTGPARLVIGVCLVAGAAALGYAIAMYGELPDRVPTHFGPSGAADAWSDKSIASVFLLPVMGLIIGPFTALMALLTASAKCSIRGGTGGRSIEAQNAFRAAITYLLTGTALFTSLLMTFLSVQSIRVGLGRAQSLGTGVWWIVGAMMLFLFGGLIFVVVRYGQGGALIEAGSPQAPLTNGLADNTHWVWGVFYVNRDDPSILVEKRFGIGYTINFGNRKAVVLMSTFLIAILGLTLVGLIAAAG